MFAHLLAAAAFGALPDPGALAVRHTFSAEQVDCASGGPHSRAELDEVQREWRSDGALHVEFWTTETASNAIDRDGSQARLQGSALTFTYHRRSVEQDSSGPLLACSMPVRMKIDFFGLRRQPYQVHVETVSSVQLGTVGE